MPSAKNFLLILSATIILTIILILLPKNTKKLTNEKTPQYENEMSVGERNLKVEIADTEEKRRKGLSGKDSLADNEGVLFVFDQENVSPPFWMKDMHFAIDIIWIDDGEVSQIDENIPAPEPNVADVNLPFYTPNQPVDYVLEVTAGFAEENGISEGDPVDLSKILNN